ncbi:unnamed protein product [Orchesella dallaii]|uniref:Uncharacterized protein n=1 Tax=Orchesella dallaii TaxID=48710 RepID=A0ABP1PLZ4_9HEXA
MEVLSHLTLFLNLLMLVINITKHGIPLPFQNCIDEIAQNQVVDCRITENHHLFIKAKDDSSDKLAKVEHDLERLAFLHKSAVVALKEEAESLKQEVGVLTYENNLLINRTSTLNDRLGACLKTIDDVREIGKILGDRLKSYSMVK